MSRPRTRDQHLPPHVRVHHGSYLYRGKKLCRVSEGEARMRELLADLKAGPPVDPQSVPQAVAVYKRQLTRLAPSTKKEHERLMDKFAAVFAKFRVDQVRALDIRQALNHYYAGRPSAHNHFKARVSEFFTWAVSIAGMCNVNPCREIRSIRERKRKTPWTDQLFLDVRELLPPMLQCYHDLSYLIYQRTTDIRLLERKQIDEDAGVIHFQPTKTLRSTGGTIDIRITPAIDAVLKRAAALSKEAKIVCPYVIHTATGEAFSRSGLHSAYRRADEKIVGKDEKKKQRPKIGLNPKALRPYAATAARRAGYTLPQIQAGLVHASASTTEGYIQQHGTPVSELVMRLPERTK